MRGSTVPDWLIKEANRCPETRGRVKKAIAKPIYCDGKIVGLYCPHWGKLGFYTGPTYITPAYRRRGLAFPVLSAIKERSRASIIEYGNTASEELVRKLGFVRFRRYSHGWYWILR